MSDKELKISVNMRLLAIAQPKIANAARMAIEKAKAMAIGEFTLHPITQALEQHTSGGLGEGTLFGFIGFEEGTEPTEPIRAILYSQIEFEGVTQLGNSLLIRYSYPSPEDIYEVTPLPWAEGRSWAEMIDTTGIPGLGLYIPVMNIDKSRSKEGLQENKSGLAGNTYKGIPYIKRILSNFEKNAKTFLKSGIEFQ